MEIVLTYTASNHLARAVPLPVLLIIRAVTVLPFAFLGWSCRPSQHWGGLAVLALLQVVWVLAVSNSPAV
jgi:hypothetical protein